MIKAAAIRVRGVIYTGKNHSEIMRKVWLDFPDEKFYDPDVMGFVNEEGKFFRRAAAMHEALKCNQVEYGKTFQPRYLFSEDLLPNEETKNMEQQNDE